MNKCKFGSKCIVNVHLILPQTLLSSRRTVKMNRDKIYYLMDFRFLLCKLKLIAILPVSMSVKKKIMDKTKCYIKFRFMKRQKKSAIDDIMIHKSLITTSNRKNY